MNRRFACSILFVSLFGALLNAQTLDRIVAVVDDELILESELNAQVQFFVFNNKLDQNTPGMREQVLQSMINEKLILAQAIEDSIVVTDDEVQQQLDATIQQRIQQVGSEERLAELYGMPISRIKREFREEMRKSLLANRLQQQRFGTAHVTQREVEDFYRQFKDSLGTIPEEVELSHIYMEPKFGEEARTVARAKILGILDSIKAGADFAGMARRYSEDPGSSNQGGDLGLVRRGQFVKEFESVVFSLKEQQISDPVETKFGVHIIELMERRGEAVRARHILLRIPRTQADEDSVITKLAALRERALAGESFSALAKLYSEDTETALLGGALGTAEISQLEKRFYPTVALLHEGEISEPVKLSSGGVDGYHVVQMKRRTPAHEPSLEQDYQRLEMIALNYKRNKEYTAWLEDLKGKIYWQSRL